MLLKWFIGLVVVLCHLGAFSSLGKAKLGNPVSVFLITNLLMSLGIIAQVDINLASDYAHLWMMIITAVLYSGSVVVFSRVMSVETDAKAFFSSPLMAPDKRNARVAWAVFVFSAVISVMYFVAVGYNFIFLAFTGGIEDPTTMRLQSYAGENYFAPGYVNQFKNMLLPLSFIVLSVFLYNKSKRFFLIFFVPAALFVLVSLLGTGQRAFFFGFMVIGIIALLCMNRKLNLLSPRFLIVYFLFLFLFSVMSVHLGRSSDAGFSSALLQLWHRFFYSNQSAAIHAFRYVYDLEVVWGQEWFLSLRGVLPGYVGSDLASRIHEILFGSSRGTAPVSMWGGVFHNWGWLGLAVFPSLLALVHMLVAKFFYTGVRSVVRCVGYAALSFILGTWMAGSPIAMLNNGLVAAVFFLIVFRLRMRLHP